MRVIGASRERDQATCAERTQQRGDNKQIYKPKVAVEKTLNETRRRRTPKEGSRSLVVFISSLFISKSIAAHHLRRSQQHDRIRDARNALWSDRLVKEHLATSVDGDEGNFDQHGAVER